MMYLEAKETARLYQLLSDKLGNETTETLFKYIDNKTERAVDVAVKSLSTKEELATTKHELVRAIRESKADTISWMLIFWMGQIGVTVAAIALYLKK